MGHETKIIIKNANHNKLWNLISNKSGVEEWNYRKKKKEIFLKRKTNWKKTLLLEQNEWNETTGIWLRNSEWIEI
jgi:hypothetical protein